MVSILAAISALIWSVVFFAILEKLKRYDTNLEVVVSAQRHVSYRCPLGYYVCIDGSTIRYYSVNQSNYGVVGQYHSSRSIWYG